MQQSRRGFFRSASLPAILPATWTSLAAALQGATPDQPDKLWALVKSQFPLDEKIVYLNAANVCPASRPVMDRHLEYLRDFHANPSFQNRDKYVPLRESLRTKIAGMLRVSGDEIAITRNTSEGSNIVVRGVDLKQGDEVIITDHNHPSNNESWNVRAKREGFVVRTVPVQAPAKSKEELIACIDRAVSARTRVIAVTQLTSTTGILFPVREIGQIARKHNCFYHVDGAQTFGALDVNLSEIGCDSWSTSAHKWLMGPLEAGILYVRQERIPQIWPSIVTAGWADDLKGARKFEVFGQRDDPRVVALEAAIDFVQMIGMGNVETRVRMLAAHAKAELSKLPNVQLKTNREPELSAGVIKFRLANVPTKRAYDTLWEKNRVAIALTASGDAEGLRFSPHIYNSPEEIDRAISAVKAL